ncbi:RNA-binding protein [Halobacteriales archaeon QS_1_68_20]|nr:MAG: RNA-binding protein [Halobacteriales archaeon QS_1_68_20]
MNVRVRGIYATALTRRFLAADHAVVQASGPIDRRFDASFPVAPADVAAETTDDRQGVGLVGTEDAVETATGLLADVAVDAIPVPDPTPLGAVFDSTVTETLGRGAVVDLGERDAYLPYSKVDDHVEVGDVVRVQVREPAPPWADQRPVVGTTRHAGRGLATLRAALDGTRVNADDEAARELAGMTDLLDVETPPGWGIEWSRTAVDADLDALEEALQRAVDRATDLIGLPDERDPPGRLVAPTATAWCWFGRESRFALDETRAEVTTTMPGHHRIKAGSEHASAGVDFVEAACDDLDGKFPFETVVDQFGPREGDRVALQHGKPDGSLIVLGRGEVTDVDPSGQVTVRRTASGRGTYDALGTPREPGDVAITRLKEGRWWYATAYRGEDGEKKGTYVNVCTPVEVFPGAVRYVDLYVDVVQYPDGTVERVDDDELDEAVEAGHVAEDLAAKAREVASTVEDALAD